MLAICICTLLLCSCNKQNDEIPEGMQLVTSEYFDSKFFVPNDWTPVTTTGTLVAKAPDNSNVSIQKMAINSDYTNADAYFRTDYFPKLTSTFKSITLLEEECSVENQKFGTINNGAAKYVYITESDGSVYKTMQYFSLYSGYLYIFTYTAEQSLFDEHLEEVASIVSNFVY